MTLTSTVTSYFSSASFFSFRARSAKCYRRKKTPKLVLKVLDGRGREECAWVEVGAPGKESALKSARPAVIQPAEEQVNATPVRRDGFPNKPVEEFSLESRSACLRL